MILLWFILRMKVTMYLTVKSTTGCFNLLNPREESIETRIIVYGDNGKIVHNVSISTGSDFNHKWKRGCEANDAFEAIADHRNRTWIDSGRPQWEAAEKFIRNNELQLDIGCINKLLLKLEEEAKDIQKRIEGNKRTREYLKRELINEDE